MPDRIMTLHPEGKQGVNIDRSKYDVMKQAILGILREYDELTFKELTQQVKEKLKGKFEGSISWYFTTVKLDLEARNFIERISDRKP